MHSDAADLNTVHTAVGGKGRKKGQDLPVSPIRLPHHQHCKLLHSLLSYDIVWVNSSGHADCQSNMCDRCACYINCVAVGSDKYFDEKDNGTAAATGAEGEMYPYVSFTINIDS